MMHRLVIVGPPRTKKTHNELVRRRSRRTGKMVTIVLPSKQWRRWVRVAVILELRDDAAAVTPYGAGRIFLGLAPLTAAPLHCRAVFYRDAERGDAVGYYQGLADLLEKRGVIRNDRQIVDWSGSTLVKDAADPRVEVTLEEVAA